VAELLVARDHLQVEGERVRRINANYAHLAQSASASVKVITESIGRWRSSEEGVKNFAAPMIGRATPSGATHIDAKAE
jgi:hypothetical protein